MKDQDLTDTIGQVKNRVDEVLSMALPRSEADERMKRIEADLGKAMDALQSNTIRQTAMSGSASGAGAWFAQQGIKSMKQLQGYTTHDRNGRGQTTNRLVVPDEVRSALVGMDHLHIADTLLTLGHGAGKGREWTQQKQEQGIRAAMLNRMPGLAASHDAVHKDFMQYTGKALTSTASGTGDEWVPTMWATSILDEVRLACPVVNLIPHVPQPSNPWRYPLLSGVGTAYRKVENTNAPSSDITTAQRDWTAHTFSTYMALSDEMDDDGLVAIIPELRAAIIRAMAEGVEMALVNGDADAATHFDTDYRYSSGNYQTYQGGVSGLRHFALDGVGSGTNSSVSGGGDNLSYADVGSAAAAMGKFAAGRISQGEVALLVNAEGWLDLLTEADSPVTTLEKYGTGASLLTGELGRIFGIPVFISHAVEARKDSVTTAGINAASANTLSTAILFNRMNSKIGDRRDFRLETDRDIVAGRTDLVGTMRLSHNFVEGDISDGNFGGGENPAVCAIVNID